MNLKEKCEKILQMIYGMYDRELRDPDISVLNRCETLGRQNSGRWDVILDIKNLIETEDGSKRKIVICTHYLFDLSPLALKRYNELSGKKERHAWDIPRDDKNLVAVVEELKEKANKKTGGGDNTHNSLCVVEIPADVEWVLEQPDWCAEYIAEKHRTWNGKRSTE